MISVVIPLYNKATTIVRALRSIQRQTLSPDEIIVVDDGSTDGSATLLPEDPHIKLIRQTNQGVSAARNQGIAESQGEYVAFLDADDEWQPDFLARLHHLSEVYPSCNIYAAAYSQCNHDGQLLPIRLHHLPFASDEGLLDNYFDVAAHSDPPINSSSLMVRRSALLAVGGFPTNISQGEDLLTWARLAIDRPIAYTTDSLTIFHNDSIHSIETPKRIPSANDAVGDALTQLYHNHPNTVGLQAYIALWHKMRASIYLRLPHYRRQCRQEITIAHRWNPALHMTHYRILLLLPFCIRQRLIQTTATQRLWTTRALHDSQRNKA